MKINEESNWDQMSLRESIENLKSALVKRIDAQDQNSKQNITLALNGHAQAQKVEVEMLVKQVQAAKSHGLQLDNAKVLMPKANSLRLMEKWKQALNNSDTQLGHQFSKESIEWASGVKSYVEKVWVFHCETLLGKINKMTSLLRSLNKFDKFKEQNRLIVESLDFAKTRHINLTLSIKSDEARDFISDLEVAIRDLGALPSGLNEFLDAVNSSQGYSYDHFDKDDNQELRHWLETNDFFQYLILRLKN